MESTCGGGRCACSAHAIRLSFGFILIRVSVVRGRSLYSVLNYIRVTILSSIQFYDTSFLQHYNNTSAPSVRYMVEIARADQIAV